MKKIFSIAAVIVAALFASAGVSAQTYSGYNVGSNEARRVIQLQEGVVLDILPLAIEKGASTEARSAGGVIGGLIGVVLASAGRNDNWGKTAALGSLGALAGDAVARRASESRVESMQIVVRTSSGQVIAVAQEGAGEGLRQGDPVYVMYGETTRVVRSNKPAGTSVPAPAATTVPSSIYSAQPWPSAEMLRGGYQQASVNWPR